MTTPYSGWGFDVGHLSADVDMDDHQWKFMTTASTAEYFKVGTGASGPVALGVLQDDPRVGEPGSIRVLGETKVAASGAIGYADLITCGSNGFAIVTTTACTNAAGIALSAITSGSGYITALLVPCQVLADNTP